MLRMKKKNLISLALSALMLVGTAMPVVADGENEIVLGPTTLAELEGYEKLCDSDGTELYVNRETGDVEFVLDGKVLFAESKAQRGEKPQIDKTDKNYSSTMSEFFSSYYTTSYTSPQEYVACTMKLIYEKGNYAIFIDENTGAAAFLDVTSGKFLTTNPYDVGSSKANEKTKQQLLSQFVFDYVKGNNGDTYSTFGQSALNEQVSISRIRGGVRVEYTVGRQEARILAPMMIEQSRFEEEILAKITVANATPDATLTDEQLAKQVERDRTKLSACYSLMSTETRDTEKAKRDLLLKYPILKDYAFYMFNDSSTRLRYEVESIIKEYTGYTFEDMQADHELLEYSGNESTPPLFKMAIEYYIDDNGLKVRVPAKSISYNKSAFDITALRVLPYLGAGRQSETGYTFYPDGSGVLVRFEDIGSSTRVISGKVYGQDYAFHAASGQNKEVMRLPAFGVKLDQNYTIVEHSVDRQERIELDGMITVEEYTDLYGIDVKSQNDTFDPNDIGLNPVVDGRTAYIAYMEEGDSMVQISTDHGGVTHEYHSTYATVYPEMTDTYALTGISSTGDAKWTVGVNRGYTGNYTFRIFMLDGDDANYVGMAKSVREYLVATGALTKSENNDENIALFLENFGSVKTSQKFLGMPITENTPLTTFEQSEKMITELKEAGVSNINLKLTGWYNGGMDHTAPTKLKVQKAIGGRDGLIRLSEFAAENGVGLYPDIEFTYVTKDTLTDGFSYKKDAVQTVNNKAASHRVYSALYQGFDDDDTLIVNAERMLKMYDKIAEKYSSMNIGGMAVSSLGSDLSSDNDEDNELTREEAKTAIVSLLGKIKEDNGKILVSGGNAYTWSYADLITDLPLDSSRNVYASEAVPFLGMVLHGYVEYTGTAINLDGDYGYSVLKCIENGASPYFILSYTDDEIDNTSELKKFEQFSKYYSIKYNIWKKDLVETYTELNEALRDVKDATLSGHAYIDDNIVKVDYSNGKSFVLNYGINDYDYEGTVISSLGFIAVQD